MSFVYKADPTRGKLWAELFAQYAPHIKFYLWPETGDPLEVEYLAVWQPPENMVQRFPNLKILFSIAAGVDQIDFNGLPESLPVVRMIEPGLSAGMVEYVTWAVLDLHRDMAAYRRQQLAQVWKEIRVLPAKERRIGVLGMGELGRAVLGQLQTFGFACAGWSRSPRQMPSVACYCGADALADFLGRSDILICLLPLTPETRGMLNTAFLSQLPAGASLVHVGRGPQLVTDDLLRALDSGHLREAILDVTDPEPLPANHPLWTHPHVTLTPHIASMTQPDTAIEVVLDNLQNFKLNRPLIGLVDRKKGY